MFHFFSNVMAGAAILWHGVAGGPASTTPILPQPVHQEQVVERGMANAMGKKPGPGITGKVVAVSGTTLTVASKVGEWPLTFLVDVSAAKVVRPNALATTSVPRDILVGDFVAVQGKPGIVPITATQIYVGKPQERTLEKPEDRPKPMQTAPRMPMMQERTQQDSD